MKCVVGLSLVVFAALVVGCGPKGVILSSGNGTIKMDSYREISDFQWDGVVKINLGGRTAEGSQIAEQSVVMDATFVSDSEADVVFVKHESSLEAEMYGDKEKTSDTEALQNKAYKGKRIAGGWQFELQDGDPTPDDEKMAEILSNLIHNDRVYPSQRVKEGDRWAVGNELVKKWKAFDVDEMEGEGSIEYFGLITYDGSPCARLLFNWEGRMKMEEEGVEGGEMTLELSGEIIRTLDTFQDIKVEAEGTMKMSGKETEHGQDMDLAIVGPLRIQSRIERK